MFIRCFMTTCAVMLWSACGDADVREGSDADASIDATDTSVAIEATPDVALEVLEIDSALPPSEVVEDVAADEEVAACGEAPYAFGCACGGNEDCGSGWCLPVDDAEAAMRCTRTCQDTCPAGWECRAIAGAGDPVFLCQPPVDTLCAPCTQNADCRLVGAQCLTFPDGSFCGRDCAGGAACSDGYVCQSIVDAAGKAATEQCVPASGSCMCEDGTDYANDPDNCGVCGNACAYAGAEPRCVGGECTMGACLPGFVDLDASPDNGCEYACTFVSVDDEPEASCVGSACDQDCDGIDGSYAAAVFVSGSGAQGASGAPYDPIGTVPEAIAKAVALGRRHVYVAAGTYLGEVHMVAGVSIFGGYSDDRAWTRDLSLNRSILTNDAGTNSVRVVIAQDIKNQRTVLDGFQIVAGPNPNPSGSSYAIHVTGCDASLEIRNASAVGGQGGAGADGVSGGKGIDGSTGNPGTRGDKDDGCNESALNAGFGGAGATNVCTTGSDARGGKGGRSGCGNPDNETKPKPEDGDISPGGGERGRVSGGAGGPGGPGAAGRDGLAGNGAGAVQGGFWRGHAGEDGAIGGNGAGGGGGAGGNGGIKVFAGRWGGGGGGGGSGGCGGGLGRGGGSGGGSFGVFLVDASPTLVAVAIGHRSGGNGGKGGAGGGGGAGRAGGAAGMAYDEYSAAGGAGGSGGGGGRGGHGAGGDGGVAYGLYLSGTSDPRCQLVTFNPPNAGGSGGAGGVSADGLGNRGANGNAGDRNTSSPSCP